MIRKFSLLLPFVVLYLHAAAQEEVTHKTSNHYVGVQANQLLRQLFNFGGSAGSINNPYLITYAVNSVMSGWGFNSGLGYTHLEVSNEDPFNPIQTTIDDFFVRLGIERKVPIGMKWTASYGLDILRESEKNITESRNPQSGSFNTDTRSKSTGVGLRSTLNFNISEKILLGTEATYYYKSTKETRKGANLLDETEKFKQFNFTAPIALFLIVKL